MTTSIHQACLEGNIRMVENLINNDHHAIHSKDEVKKTDLVESFFSPNTYPTNFKDERSMHLCLSVVSHPLSSIPPSLPSLSLSSSSPSLGMFWKQTTDR